jgi:hypothetical protein
VPDADKRPGPADLVAALEKLRQILSAAQAQVTVALEEAAKLPSPPRSGRSRCPHCGILRPTAELDDHLVNVHGLTLEAAS